MNSVKITPKELRKMMTSGWLPVGFQQTMAESEISGSAGGTSGYAVLLKNDYDLAIVSTTLNRRTGSCEMTIMHLTSDAG